LVEPSAQNLGFHSTDWTSNWNAGGSNGTTVITNSAISLAPDGTATANEIHPTSGNTNHSRVQNSTTLITFVSGTVYTQSAFFKAGAGTTGQFVQLTYSAARFPQNGYANFDLNAGTVLVVSGTTADANRAARIENYGNGWYRCSFTATCPAAGTGNGVVPILINASGDSRAPSFAGTVTDYILGWGAQVETGSVATSYIPTTTGSVTRAAEVVSVSGAVSGSIGQTEGTIYAEFFVDFNNRDADIFSVDGGSTSDGFFMSIRSSSVVQLIVRTASANALIFQRAGTYPTGVNKLAVAYKNGDFAICLNGTTVQTNTSAITMPSVSINRASLCRNSLYNLNQQLRIRAAALYTTRLSDADLTLLTMPGNNTYLPQAVWNNYLSRTGNTELPDCLYTRHADLLDV
jgi:hypothetical protein